MSMPTLFVSHGSPMLYLEKDVPGRAFLASLGQQVPRPKAILAVSAHWNTEQPAVSLAAKPETIHDFYGFPEALYRLRYDAPGAPELAARVAELTGVADKVETGDEAALANYRNEAPHAREAHPTDEHFLPLHVAFGAAGKGAHGRVLHRSFTSGNLSMAAYAFD